MSIRPKLTASQLLLGFQQLAGDFSGRDAFEHLQDHLRTVGWNALHQKMHVILIRPISKKSI